MVIKKSKSAKKPNKSGCAPVYKESGGLKYFPRTVNITYTDMNGKEHTEKHPVSDYWYDSANGKVGKVTVNFKETATRKKDFDINTGSESTEKALAAIVNYIYDNVGQSGISTMYDVEIRIKYFQPKVPNKVLTYYRTYDKDGKPVETLLSVENLGTL